MLILLDIVIQLNAVFRKKVVDFIEIICYIRGAI